MTDESDESSPPDATYTSEPFSRRKLLAAGLTAATSGMAGCADCYGPQECGAAVSEEIDSALQGDSDEGPSREEEYERTRTQLEVVEGYDLEVGEATLDSIQLTLKNGLLPHQQPEEAVEGTLRICGKTPLGENEVVLSEKGASFRGSTQEHEIPLEFGEDLMNTPRELEVRFASPQLAASEVVLGTSDVVYLPFDNVARDEQTLRDLGPKYMSDEEWGHPHSPKQTAEIWYNELDQPTFNMPALDMSEYDTKTVEGDDWFDLYDIQLTAVIRTVMLDRHFPVEGEDAVQGPYFDWTVVDLELSALEYLESIYFNSPPTMLLHNIHEPWSVGEGGFRQKEVGDKTDYGGALLVGEDQYSKNIFRDSEVPQVAQHANPASDSFIRGTIYEDEVRSDRFDPNELRTVNPVKFCTGRSMCRRWGEQFSAAVENKPYADTFGSLEYQKMTTLKAFVGGFDYEFTITAYQQTPEETIVNYFLLSKGVDRPGADCVTSTMLFIGIAYWMTGKHPLMIRTEVFEGLGHIFAGFHDLDMPRDKLSSIKNHPSSAYGGFEESAREADEPGYSYTDVECTEPYPTIGYNRPSLKDSTRRAVCWSNLDDLSLTTMIPLNDNWEPDVDGEIRAPGNGFFRDSYVNPFDTTAFYYFEDERNR